MAPKQNPMSLEDLPGYLQSRNLDSPVGAPVVEMGQIIVPEKKFKWSHLLFAAVLFMSFSIGGLVTYDVMSTEQLTVVMDINSGVDADTIPQIVSDSGGRVLSVTQKDDSTYEVKLKTRNKVSFLEWLLKNSSVKKAELEE